MPKMLLFNHQLRAPVPASRKGENAVKYHSFGGTGTRKCHKTPGFGHMPYNHVTVHHFLPCWESNCFQLEVASKSLHASMQCISGIQQEVAKLESSFAEKLGFFG